MDDNTNLNILEAIIFSSTEPVHENDLKEKINDKNKFNSYIDQLINFYSNRGINLIKTGEYWSFRTSPKLKDVLTIQKNQKRKLSKAAIETLAIIAYMQPVTRAEVEDIRGVQMGRGSIDNLMEIGWIKPKGRKNSPGRPTTWGTTDIFLQHFGLDNINDLPSKEELKASGFLEKRSAISTITDLAKEKEISQFNDNDIIPEENLDDFISNK